MTAASARTPKLEPEQKPSTSPKYEFRNVEASFSYWPMALDFSLRILVFILWRIGLISYVLYWIYQILFISFIVVVWATVRSDSVNKAVTSRLKAKENIPDNVIISLDIRYPAFAFLFGVILVLGAFPFISTSITFPYIWLSRLTSISLTTIYAIYVFALGLWSSSERDPTSFTRENPRVVPDLVQLIGPDELRSHADGIPAIDRNDEEITFFETSISSISDRIESYTLESTLFGALAFSGFLALISGNLDMLDQIAVIGASLEAIFDKLIQLQFDNSLLSDFSMITTRQNLILAAVSIETLTCSLFFLLVVVYRIQYSDALRTVNYVVALARRYNDKEEEIYRLKLELSSITEREDHNLADRLHHLHSVIQRKLLEAQVLFNELLPAAMYMQLFRNLGLASFALILITSSLLISGKLTAMFGMLLLLAIAYSVFEKYMRLNSVYTFYQFRLGRWVNVRLPAGLRKR